MEKTSPKFIQGIGFDSIESLPNNGTKYLLVLVIHVKKFQTPSNL